MGPTRMMTVKEFCEEMGVSRSTFYEWRAKRRAPKCIKLPNSEIRIRRSDYERWLEQREEGV
ncbi:DNA binding domain, excisionase family [Actinokineospora sp. UTMC 2448]|nr:DNA binding domain, excisionase family [Actinokineospora sp. UTMC 2448]